MGRRKVQRAKPKATKSAGSAKTSIPTPPSHSTVDYSRWDNIDDSSDEEEDEVQDESEDEDSEPDHYHSRGPCLECERIRAEQQAKLKRAEEMRWEAMLRRQKKAGQANNGSKLSFSFDKRAEQNKAASAGARPASSSSTSSADKSGSGFTMASLQQETGPYGQSEYVYREEDKEGNCVSVRRATSTDLKRFMEAVDSGQIAKGMAGYSHLSVGSEKLPENIRTAYSSLMNAYQGAPNDAASQIFDAYWSACVKEQEREGKVNADQAARDLLREEEEEREQQKLKQQRKEEKKKAKAEEKAKEKEKEKMRQIEQNKAPAVASPEPKRPQSGKSDKPVSPNVEVKSQPVQQPKTKPVQQDLKPKTTSQGSTANGQQSDPAKDVPQSRIGPPSQGALGQIKAPLKPLTSGVSQSKAPATGSVKPQNSKVSSVQDVKIPLGYLDDIDIPTAKVGDSKAKKKRNKKKGKLQAEREMLAAAARNKESSGSEEEQAAPPITQQHISPGSLAVEEVSDEEKMSGASDSEAESESEDQLDPEHVSNNPFDLLEAASRRMVRRKPRETPAGKPSNKGTKSHQTTAERRMGSASGTDHRSTDDEDYSAKPTDLLTEPVSAVEIQRPTPPALPADPAPVELQQSSSRMPRTNGYAPINQVNEARAVWTLLDSALQSGDKAMLNPAVISANLWVGKNESSRVWSPVANEMSVKLEMAKRILGQADQASKAPPVPAHLGHVGKPRGPTYKLGNPTSIGPAHPQHPLPRGPPRAHLNYRPQPATPFLFTPVEDGNNSVDAFGGVPMRSGPPPAQFLNPRSQGPLHGMQGPQHGMQGPQHGFLGPPHGPPPAYFAGRPYISPPVPAGMHHQGVRMGGPRPSASGPPRPASVNKPLNVEQWSGEINSVTSKVSRMGLSLADELEDEGLCIICMEWPHAVRVDPCGHANMCRDCAEKIKCTAPGLCPTCRNPIVSIVDRPSTRD